MLGVLSFCCLLIDSSSHAYSYCNARLGDNGSFYVPETLVDVYVREVIPQADVLTPNQFEVEALTGVKVLSLVDARKACAMLHDMGPSLVFITSLVLKDGENDPGTMSIVASQRNDDKEASMWKIDCPILSGVFTGTGDLCAALLLAHTADIENSLSLAMEKVISTMYAILLRTHKASGKR